MPDRLDSRSMIIMVTLIGSGKPLDNIHLSGCDSLRLGHLVSRSQRCATTGRYSLQQQKSEPVWVEQWIAPAVCQGALCKFSKLTHVHTALRFEGARSVKTIVKCKPSANCACAVPLIDGLGWLAPFIVSYILCLQDTQSKRTRSR